VHVSLSIVRPNPGHWDALENSMRRFAETARQQEGLVLCSTFRDSGGEQLFGIAVWESEQAAAQAGPALMASVEGDDFETWVAEMHNYGLEEVSA